ncbi:MAG: hypothetical protein GYA52_05300 [Chloroflexi bacterium]|nr:hypothetical protein [Chloroflexota bacterium]
MERRHTRDDVFNNAKSRRNSFRIVRVEGTAAGFGMELVIIKQAAGMESRPTGKMIADPPYGRIL